MSLQIRSHPSPNFDDRGGQDVDMLVLHYTGMESAKAALARLCDESASVSAHYFVDEDGAVLKLVEEDKRAWHAGAASWRGHANINQRSIGVEIVNPGHEFGYRAFPEPQMQSVVALCRDVVSRYNIAPRDVVGHSDVAPTRKTDPGELFDWKRLADTGVGLWAGEADVLEMDRDVIRRHLETIGYDTTDFTKALRAFQRHFRGDRVTGRMDAGTARRLTALAALCS